MTEDGDVRLGGGVGAVQCPPTDPAAAMARIWPSSHVGLFAEIPTGHAAADSEGDPSVTLDAPSLAVVGDALLMSIVDSAHGLRILRGEPLDAASCPGACGAPTEARPVHAASGDPLRVRSAALLALPDGRVLVAYQPLDGALTAGTLPSSNDLRIENAAAVAPSLRAAERVALALDPATQDVVLLAREVETGRVHQARRSGAGSWRLTRPTVAEVDGGGTTSDWHAVGAVGLVAWQESGAPSRLYAAYGEAVGEDPAHAGHEQRLRLVRDDRAGRWVEVPAGRTPFDSGWQAASAVALGVNRPDQRLWAGWADPSAQIPRLRSVLPDGRRSQEHRAFNVWTRDRGPAAFVWDDRGDRRPGAFNGIRLAFATRVPCDLCGSGFYSDGVPDDGFHADQPAECVDREYCRDDREDPEEAGGFVQTGLLWLPFIDPSAARGELLDFDDYTVVFREMCRTLAEADRAREPDTDRCPPG